MASEFYLFLSLIFLFMANVSCKAFFHGKNFPNNVENEYIIVINSDRVSLPDSTFDLQSFKTKIEENYGITIKRVIEYGNFLAIMIHTNNTIDDVLEENDIDFIETNQRFSLDQLDGYDKEILAMDQFELAEADPEYNNISYCYKQNTGKDIWGLGRINQREAPKRFDDPFYSWSNFDNGTGVYAYVMDTGIYIEHSDFNGKAIHGFTSKSISEYEDNMDHKGHGTHVAAKIGGRIYGIAKNVNLIAVKVLDGTGSGTTVDLIEGLQYVYNDYNEKKKSATSSKPKIVVNLSLGAAGSAPVLENAVMACINNDIHVVVAAGNEYSDACLYTPARVSQVITVGSSTKKDKLSSFSNYGSCVDIIAPGSDIISAWITGSTSTAKASGTSMACPHVAGIVARYLSRPSNENSPSTKEVRDYIIDYSTKNVLNLDVGVNGATAASSTPNKLLFMQCTTSSASISASKASIMNISFILSVILLLSTWCMKP